MAEAFPKPKRSRWPWVVAALLFIVADAAGWWNWPRGDSRFVGKWIGRIEGNPFSRVDFEFCRNGRGQAEGGQFPFSFTMPFQWSVQGSELLLSTVDKPYVISSFTSASEFQLIDPDGREWLFRRTSE